MEQLAQNPKVIAWGEIGLDYFYDHSPREVQQQVFLRQMELARAAKLPIVIHCRPSDNSENAWDDCLASDPRTLGSSGWEEFCTASPANLGTRQAGAGPGIHDFLRRQHHLSQRRSISAMPRKEVPLDRILIETDSPFLAPVPHRGKRNEPAFVKEVARQLGEMRGLSTEEWAPNHRQFLQIFHLLSRKAALTD